MKKSSIVILDSIFLLSFINNKESKFQSAKTLLYAPKFYNIQELPNVYDKKGQGRETFGFFFPAYSYYISNTINV